MFTPFAFVKEEVAAVTPTPGIVTDQLAFYIDPANGNFNDTIGSKTGTENGTITTVSSNYWSGFSGTDYISFSSTTDINGTDDAEFTVESWFYFQTAWGGSDIKIPWAMNSTTAGAEYRFRYLGTTYGNDIQVSAPEYIDSNLANQASNFEGGWSHNVMVWKFNGNVNSSTLLYSIQLVGGSVLTGTGTGMGGPKGRRAPNNQIYVGRSTNDTINFGGGYIGPVRIYNKALTTAEIAQNYSAEVSRFT